MKEVVIVSGVRLPVGSYGGSLKDVSAIDMGAMVVKEAVNRAGISIVIRFYIESIKLKRLPASICGNIIRLYILRSIFT